MNDQVDQPTPEESYFASLVGPGKKFQTAEDMAKGKIESDQYVEILKRRQDQLSDDYRKLREETEAKAKLEDLLERIQRERLASSETTPAKEDPKQPAIDLKDIDALVTERLKQERAQEKQAANINTVVAKLREQFGDKAEEVLQTKVKELGITKEELYGLASNSPKAAISTLGLDLKPMQDPFQTPLRSQVRQDSFAPTGTPDRTWSYYQELKKTQPTAYFDRKTAVQMQEDAIRLGDRFCDGDYYVQGLHER